ncbi:MAG TPA: PAS domain S-box protein [Candidatus Thermoplasmatota archaeon]
MLAPPTPASLLEAAARAGLIFLRWEAGAGRLHLSGAVAEVLGYSPAEFEQDPGLFFRVVTPEGGGDARDLLRRLLRSSAAKEELRARAKARDGRTVLLQASLVPIRGEAGAPLGWEGFARDATSTGGIERLAAEGFERFQALFDGAPLAMVLYDPKTLAIEQANERAAHLYGVPREEMEGSFISEYVAPDEWPRVQEMLRRSTEASSHVTILQRVLHRRADGTVFPVQTAAVTVPIGGRPSRLVIVRDLTDIEAAEERLRVVYRTLEASPNATLLLDRSLAVAYANGAAEALFGRTREDLKGRTFTSLLEPRHAADFQAAQAAIAPGKGWDRRLAVVHSNGKGVRAHANVSAVPDAPEATVRCIATLRPLTRAGPQPDLTSEELAAFFDLLAHDVVNYLTAVRGYIELIGSDTSLGDRNRRMAEIAMAQSDNALDLIHDTRRVVGMERENSLELVKGDLAQVLNDAVVRVEPILKSRKFKVRRDFASHSPIISSPDVVREVFVNLLHNAVKYDANDEVVIDLVIERAGEEDAPTWRVRVGDRGSGIPDEEKPHVFERGFRRQAARADPGGAMAPKGSGIGLSICKFLVERLGGTVRVESRIPGDWRQGTNFIVELPAA